MKSLLRTAGLLALGFAVWATSQPLAIAQEDPCRALPVIAKRESNKQVRLPVLGSSYMSPRDFHAYLRAGGRITAELRARHGRFLNLETIANAGRLAGNAERFNSTLQFQVGEYGVIEVEAACETHTSAQDPSLDTQTLDTAMVSLSGTIEGTELFKKLTIYAGEAFELPSPGTTTLTVLDDGSVQVDSSFRINFRIEWTGAGPLEGQEGVTEGVMTMTAVGQELQ